MELRENKFKKILLSGDTSFGLWNGIVDTYAAEICAGSGFDWILIDGEHAPFDLRTVLTQMQAVSQFDTGLIYRPSSGDAVQIKRFLDLGVQSFLIPMVETANQAKDIVDAMRFPPKGKRGLGSALSRASQWNRVKDYYAKVEDELCLVVQIESVTGMENIDAICAIDAIDGVFIGPADLAGSMGYIGEPMNPVVVDEVKRGLQIIAASGKVPGTLAVREDIVKEYMQSGARMIGVGVDLVLLAKVTTALAAQYEKLK